MSTLVTDCRTYDGITVGLIDSLIFISRILRHRDLSSTDVKDSLADIANDDDLRFLLSMSIAQVSMDSQVTAQDGGGYDVIEPCLPCS
jgi:hypothetical protein